MKTYKELLLKLINKGTIAESRAGKVIKLSHELISFDLKEGFPAITARKFHFKPMAAELACFVKGITDNEEFKQRGCNIWTANLDDFNQRNGTPDNTDLGPIYGAQWRDFYSKDQMRDVIDRVKRDPFDRRLVVSAWNPMQLDQMALPPCHIMWQLNSVDGKRLDLIFYMRSVDMALGFPFDIASYALLLHLICHETGYWPGKVTAVLADVHIYKQNLEGVMEYLAADTHPLPRLLLEMPLGAKVEDFEPRHAELMNYKHGPNVKMEMAV